MFKDTYMSTSKPLPSIDRLREVFSYDKDTGILRWVKPSGKRVRAGSPAGCRVRRGRLTYLYTCVDKRHVYVHQVVWAIVHGKWPDQIDHEDGNGLNNRLSNLRSVPNSVNARNLSRSVLNTSGTTGVTWCKNSKRWRAQIKVNQEHMNLGLFKLKEDAVAVRKAAELKYGFHKNHDRVGHDVLHETLKEKVNE